MLAKRPIGFKAVQLFGSLQGDGDLGEAVDTEEGNTLKRSTEPSVTKIRPSSVKSNFLTLWVC